MNFFSRLICKVLLCSFFLFAFSVLGQQQAPQGIANQKNFSDRKIEALDMILVHVFGEPEFSGTNNGGLELRVSSSGDISLYLLGSVKVAGKTPAEAEKQIRSMLMKDYIRDPHVLVQVKTYRSATVTIMGQVTKPGLISLPPEQRIDILAGIAQAGGFTKLAKTSKIEFTRGGKSIFFDLNKLKKEANDKNKIWLKSDDLIYVQESAF